jgi:hypothetical protein
MKLALDEELERERDGLDNKFTLSGMFGGFVGVAEADVFARYYTKEIDTVSWMSLRETIRSLT